MCNFCNNRCTRIVELSKHIVLERVTMIGSVVRDFTANLLCLDEILAILAYSKGGGERGKWTKQRDFTA